MHTPAISILTVLKEAAGTGEVLTVVYHGGGQPGHKRRIVVSQIDGDLVYVREPGETGVKTYRLGRIELANENDDWPWIEPEDSAGLAEIDPIQYVAGWHFGIRREQLPAIGITRREYVDKATQAIARKQATAAGMAPADVRRIRRTYWAHVIGSPPRLDFHEGDLFEARGRSYAQVVKVLDATLLEAHHIKAKYRTAYQISASDFVIWLKSGARPATARQIWAYESKSAGFREFIRDPLPARLGPSMETPNIRSTMADRRQSITYHVMAYRPLSRSELMLAVRQYLSHHRRPKRGTTVVIVSIVGFDQ